jgi:hypothetical protein
MKDRYVWVIMSNDCPRGVLFSEQDANDYTDRKNAQDKDEYPQRRVFWRSYCFDRNALFNELAKED